ncbi:hypothetical protein GCM10023264_07060 [Sphingomonas daechungensis]|uniref:DUF4230 domain-containing protein n=1 Tax=Sphingomonas daechungensis TaxID=1176646 RepID=A0ABX6T0F5_9SPHN|nr:DUF4230 domain-containing protein [Sphingomonas daechungensis]QNP43029.1 DUF4230 domain-containing protein [Sphingomonas daechungensis]
MVESRLNKPLAIAAIIVALVLGVLLGVTSGIADRIFGGPNAKTIATSSLESMRAQNRLITFVARYVSVVSSEQERLGGLVSTERTLILPGNVRYEVDLSKLEPEDVRWDAGSQTLSVRIPDVEIAGPEVDLNAAREYGSGGVLATLTNAETELDSANRARAVADLRKQAQAELPMRLARDSARQAIERSFSMPLKAAGFDNAKVVAKFAFEEGADDPSYLDTSTPYNEAISEAQQRRAQGK